MRETGERGLCLKSFDKLRRKSHGDSEMCLIFYQIFWGVESVVKASLNKEGFNVFIFFNI